MAFLYIYLDVTLDSVSLQSIIENAVYFVVDRVVYDLA